MKKYFLFFLIAGFLSNFNLLAQDCDALLNDGKREYEAKNYQKAQAYFEQASKYNCKDAGKWFIECNRRIHETKMAQLKKKEAELEHLKSSSNVSPEELEVAEREVATAKNEAAAAQEMVARLEKKLADALSEKEQAEADAADARQKIYDAREKAQKQIETATGAEKKRNEIRRLITQRINANPTQSMANGSAYKGGIQGNLRAGSGIFLFENGTLYIGEFSNDNMNGKGIYLPPEGFGVKGCDYCVSYCGNFWNNKKSGVGFCYDELGLLLYNGNFDNDKPAEFYSGEINTSSPYKFEIFDCGTADKYMGQTMNGQRHGYGIYISANDDIWIGEWINGQKSIGKFI